MVSPLRKIVPAVAVGFVALLGIAGCSAGQVTQTDSVAPAVNGNKADLGDIALRDVMIAYPESGAYGKGDQAPLVLTIVNTGAADDELMSVSSPAAGSVELLGDTTVPGRTRLQVIVPEEPVEESSAPVATTTESAESSAPGTSSGEPGSATGTSGEETPSGSSAPETTATPTSEAPAQLGTMSIVLTDLVADLPIGKNVPVTFVFANAGSITLQLPIASPATARPDPTGEEDESD
ncbi:MAG: copper chaperone PCu(A)C [Actinophytocola sp.]|uniref:hypothetical protein n=1 Tax=Actinophytocola sp. TaxID=1872138 RepID=UPI00132208A8|nr:hypothetical protein [Actinophytocola sp.]MPZ83485.1 copper chaperone PCu(A)C [Actinophytocola sp.]